MPAPAIILLQWVRLSLTMASLASWLSAERATPPTLPLQLVRVSATLSAQTYCSRLRFMLDFVMLSQSPRPYALYEKCSVAWMRANFGIKAVPLKGAFLDRIGKWGAHMSLNLSLVWSFLLRIEELIRLKYYCVLVIVGEWVKPVVFGSAIWSRLQMKNNPLG